MPVSVAEIKARFTAIAKNNELRCLAALSQYAKWP